MVYCWLTGRLHPSPPPHQLSLQYTCFYAKSTKMHPIFFYHKCFLTPPTAETLLGGISGFENRRKYFILINCLNTVKCAPHQLSLQYTCLYTELTKMHPNEKPINSLLNPGRIGIYIFSSVYVQQKTLWTFNLFHKPYRSVLLFKHSI